MDIDNKKGLRIHVAPCFICWRPCNWWGRWLSLLGIFIFCAKAQKSGDGVDMEGGILLILKLIVVGRILRVSRGLWVDVIGLLLLADLIAFRSDLYLLGVDV
ncbi:hypothetical protein E1677_20640 [Salmonella enterica subsp. enterica serovar Corvallis]|nr:hypothetical protein [Salmonella enterica subsp. enterica serovar Albany]ECF2344419.1 hypothetical protein [Salmonella enterica subsp. enterica serovar Corvallis]